MYIPLAAWSALPSDEFVARLIGAIVGELGISDEAATARLMWWSFSTECKSLLSPEYVDEFRHEIRVRLGIHLEGEHEKKDPEKNGRVHW